VRDCKTTTLVAYCHQGCHPRACEDPGLQRAPVKDHRPSKPILRWRKSFLYATLDVGHCGEDCPRPGSREPGGRSVMPRGRHCRSEGCFCRKQKSGKFPAKDQSLDRCPREKQPSASPCETIFLYARPAGERRGLAGQRFVAWHLSAEALAKADGVDRTDSIVRWTARPSVVQRQSPLDMGSIARIQRTAGRMALWTRQTGPATRALRPPDRALMFRPRHGSQPTQTIGRQTGDRDGSS
jgi:hypothetical protein